MFYLATKQRSDLFLVSGTILFLSFIFTTSVLPPQNTDALNVNQKKKKSTCKCQVSYIYCCNNYCSENQTNHAYPVFLNYLTDRCETLSPNLVT